MMHAELTSTNKLHHQTNASVVYSRFFVLVDVLYQKDNEPLKPLPRPLKIDSSKQLCEVLELEKRKKRPALVGVGANSLKFIFKG